MARLAGGRPGRTLADMPGTFCARRAILGGPDLTALFFHPLTPADRQANMPVVVSYVDWYDSSSTPLPLRGCARDDAHAGCFGDPLPEASILRGSRRALRVQFCHTVHGRQKASPAEPEQAAQQTARSQVPAAQVPVQAWAGQGGAAAGRPGDDAARGHPAAQAGRAAQPAQSGGVAGGCQGARLAGGDQPALLC